MEQSAESTHLSLLQINYRERPYKGLQKNTQEKIAFMYQLNWWSMVAEMLKVNVVYLK